MKTAWGRPLYALLASLLIMLTAGGGFQPAYAEDPLTDELGDPIPAAGFDEPPPPPPPSSAPEALPEIPGGSAEAPASTPESGVGVGTVEQDVDQALSGLEVRQTEEFAQNYQWLTLGGGMFVGKDYETSGTAFFIGAGARYQLDLGHRVLITEGSVQDAISLEGGFGYYTILGYAEVDDEGFGLDEYRVMPLIGNLRYTIWFNEKFGIFAYAGMTKNIVTVVEAASNAIVAEDALSLLSSPKAAFGAGVIFEVGPSWFARFDAGTDFLGAGVVLAF